MRKTWPLILSVFLIAACSYDYGSLQGGIGGANASGGTSEMGGSSGVAGNGDASVGGSPPDAPFVTGGSGGSAGAGAGGTTRGTGGIGGVSSTPSGGTGGATNSGGVSSLTSRASGGTTANGSGGSIPLSTSSTPSGTGNPNDCSNSSTLTVVVRDFRGWTDDKGTKHPDFENGNWVSDRGIVKPDLGSDQKPVYANSGATKTVSGADSFNQWYRDVDGINMRFEIPLQLLPKPGEPGTMYFSSTAFFPIDGKGFGNQGQTQNYSFTTEIHTKFTYKGGETFAFIGDDDVFAFVNNKQVIDLGGIHVAQTGTVDMDAQTANLGIEKGKTYNMDIFHAERHITQSNFRIETKFECLESYTIP
jgi:fibro-slime domain-containing protein